MGGGDRLGRAQAGVEEQARGGARHVGDLGKVHDFLPHARQRARLRGGGTTQAKPWTL